MRLYEVLISIQQDLCKGESSLNQLPSICPVLQMLSAGEQIRLEDNQKVSKVHIKFRTTVFEKVYILLGLFLRNCVILCLVTPRQTRCMKSRENPETHSRPKSTKTCYVPFFHCLSFQNLHSTSIICPVRRHFQLF